MILWEDTKKLHELVAWVRRSTCSDFYAKKYTELPEAFTGSIEDVPFLTRAEFGLTSPDDRLYVAKRDIAQILYTSGTTSGVPLVAYFADIENYHFDPALGTGTQCVLAIHPQTMKIALTFSQMCRGANPQVTPLLVEPTAYANGAVLAAKVHADTLYATPTQAIALAPYFDEHYDRNAFKLVAMISETLTETKMQQLRTLYPTARIANLYASAELGTVALAPCPHILESFKTSFHFNPEGMIAVELVDGELVLTYGLNRAFPVIRYKTGDHFEIDDTACPCGNPHPTIRFAGRDGVDLIRTHGFEIRAENVDTFFATVPQNIVKKQLHFLQSPQSADMLDVRVEVVLKDRPADSAHIADLIKEDFIERFAATSGRTMAELIEKGIIATVVVNIVDEVSAVSMKQKPLVNHLT